MPIRRQNCEFDAEDRKVYDAWLRRTLVTYGALVLFGIALVALQATTQTANIAEFAAAAVSMTGP
jgi:hypothetical protein